MYQIAYVYTTHMYAIIKARALVAFVQCQNGIVKSALMLAG